MTMTAQQKILAEMNERSYLQWTLIRSLAFGERDWMVLSAIFFLLSDARDFLTVGGVLCWLMGVFFVGPVFGIMIYLTSKFIYFRQKRLGTLPSTEWGMKKIAWIANAWCAPGIVFLAWQSFDLFFRSYEDLLALGTGLR